MFAGLTTRTQRLYRDSDLVRFALDVISDENGDLSYRLCAQAKRHYLVKYKSGQPPRLQKGFVPCDGSCRGGKPVTNCSPQTLVALGINKKLEPGEIFVALAHTGRGYTYTILTAGAIISPLAFGKMLQSGTSMEVEKVLDPPIDLTPAGYDYRGHYNHLIHIAKHKITNNNGQAVVDTTEEEVFRRWEAEINRELAERTLADERRRKDYARDVSVFLKRDCGFSHEQVGELFSIAGPGQCRDAVERARRKMEEMADPLPERNLLDDWDGMDLDIMASAYRSSLDRKDWRRIEAGADYIISIGGVPADKKKEVK